MAMEDSATSSDWLRNQRGVKLYLRRWEPPPGSAVKALLVMVHGWSWHSLYFSDFGTAAAAQGVEVVSFDLQGHGRSESLHGMRGYARRMSDHCADVAAVLAAARERRPGVPAVLLGESLGGTIVLRLLQLRPELQEQLAGLVLLGPLVRVPPAMLPPPPVLWIMRLLARLFPTMSVPDDSIARGFEQAFGDPEFAAKARKDPLVVFDRPRIACSMEILDACAALAADMESVRLPLLVLHGALDSRTQPAHSLELGRRASSADKEVELVEGAQHQLLQDTGLVRAATTARVAAWVLAHA